MGEQNMTDSTIGFIGLGLIGGSIARAIKRRQPQVRIMAYMRTRARLEPVSYTHLPCKCFFCPSRVTKPHFVLIVLILTKYRPHFCCICNKNAV